MDFIISLDLDIRWIKLQNKFQLISMFRIKVIKNELPFFSIFSKILLDNEFRNASVVI